MKKKSPISRLLTRLLSLAMVALGFSACNSFNEEPECMYGTPLARYNVKGKVVANENKKEGLEGIRVLIRPDHRNYQYADTLYTDQQGEFIFTESHFPTNQIGVIYEDITSNVYKKDSINVELKKTGKGDGAWDMGEYSADVVIEMEKKTEEEI